MLEFSDSLLIKMAMCIHEWQISFNIREILGSRFDRKIWVAFWAWVDVELGCNFPPSPIDAPRPSFIILEPEFCPGEARAWISDAFSLAMVQRGGKGEGGVTAWHVGYLVYTYTYIYIYINPGPAQIKGGLEKWKCTQKTSVFFFAKRKIEIKNLCGDLGRGINTKRWIAIVVERVPDLERPLIINLGLQSCEVLGVRT